MTKYHDQMSITLLVIVFLIFIKYFSSNITSKCNYIDENINYNNILCCYEIYHYIAIYDLCNEEYPNFSCFTPILPNTLVFTIYNTTIKQIKKRICNTFVQCSYIKQIKGSYPLPIGNNLNLLMKLRRIILLKLNSSKKVNLVIGSGISYNYKNKTISDEWIHTDQDVLDITNRYDITQYLIPYSVDYIIAMHVFEHITYYNIFNSLLNLKFLLKQRGKIIFCLPDINANYSSYWNNYTHGVIAQPLYGHRVFYSYKSLKYIAEKC